MKYLISAVLLFAPVALLTAQPVSVFIEDLTWTEIRVAIAGGKKTAIYYAGSTEQNGPHLAVGKHNFIARYLARRVAEELGDALVYPIMPFAPTGDPIKKTQHMRFPGSVSLSEETFSAVAREVALSAIDAGFTNIVLISDHAGGQAALKSVADGLEAEWHTRGFHVYFISDAYQKEKDQAREYMDKHKLPFDKHAGLDDTSELMFIDPHEKWVHKERFTSANDSSGVLSDPREASVELGKMFITWKVANAVAQIRTLISTNR